MAEKCTVCAQPVEVIFLEKIRGTYVKNSKGKRLVVCSTCQKEQPAAIRAAVGR